MLLWNIQLSVQNIVNRYLVTGNWYWYTCPQVFIAKLDPAALMLTPVMVYRYGISEVCPSSH